MKVHVVTSGLYHEYKIDSIYMDREKAKEKKTSLEAMGAANVVVHDFMTMDGLDKALYKYYYEAEIRYNKKVRYLNNIILEHPERIMKKPIEKRQVPNREYDREQVLTEDETVIIYKSYVSRDHCLGLLKDECEKILKDFDK
jgi:hypothetical protein